MKGLIDFEAHNAQVRKIDEAKALLEQGIPKVPKKVRVFNKEKSDSSYITFRTNNNQTLLQLVNLHPAGWGSTYAVELSVLRDIAAIAIRLTGDITEEELNQVVVEE